MKKVPNDRTGFDELIFENRNREYGAYMLRKKYSARVSISVFIAIIIASLVVVMPFIGVISKKQETGNESRTRYVNVRMEDLMPPKEEKIIPPAGAPPPPSSAPSVKYVAPEIVDTVLATEKTPLTVAEVQATPPDNNNEELTVVSTGAQEELIGSQEGNTNDEPFILVEVKPTFKGGDIEKFREWVQKRVVYPQQAQDNGIQGRVYLTFVIERDGSVSNVVVTRGPDPLLNEEAKKGIMASPKWTPGMQRGRPVRVRYSIFLNFTL